MRWALRHLKKLGKIVAFPVWVVKKLFRDIWSTLYDDPEYKYMSLPRFFCFGMFTAVVLAWIFEQCMKMPFEHYAELTGAFGIAMGGYVGKKIAERPAKNGGETNVRRTKDGGTDGSGNTMG